MVFLPIFFPGGLRNIMTTSEEQFHEELVAMVSQGQRDDGSVTRRITTSIRCAVRLRKDVLAPYFLLLLLLLLLLLSNDIISGITFMLIALERKKGGPPRKNSQKCKYTHKTI